MLAAYVIDNHSLVAGTVVQLIAKENNAISPENRHRLFRYIIKKFTVSENANIPEWWNVFRTSLANTSIIQNEETGTAELVKKELNDISISQLNGYKSYNALTKDYPQWKNIISYHRFATKIIEVIKGTSGSIDGCQNAEGQIALSEYANLMLHSCKRCYNSNRYWDAKPVLEIIKVLRELYAISYSSKTKDECGEFGKALKEKIKYLAPDEVHQQSEAIRKEIEDFCEKPDEARWSIALVRNCVPYLKQIKSILGVENPYYLRISSKIADNAIYSCSNEVEAAKRKYNNPQNDKDAALKYLCHVLQSAKQLCADLGVLNIEPSVFEQKLSKFEKSIDEYCGEHEEIKLHSCCAAISLQTEEETLASCDDYASLQEFVRNNPHSPYIKEAMRRIWEIEDAAYPKMGLYIDVYKKAFLYYKEQFPYSHNEAKVLEGVNRFFLGNEIASPDIYRKMLALWPNHPQIGLIKERIDHATYKECHNIEALKSYLKEFPQGLHYDEASKRVQELTEAAIQEEYDKCKTIDDFNRFILKHHSHRLCQNASAKIQALKEAEIQSEYNKCQSVADYNRFILKYPSHKLCQSASERIEELLYIHAQSGNYNEYYKMYPHGRYLKALKEKEEKDLFKRCKTVNDYKQYVMNYPNGAYADIAHEVIRRSKRDKIMKYGLVIMALCSAILLVCLIRRCSSAVEENPPQNTNIQSAIPTEIQDNGNEISEDSIGYAQDAPNTTTDKQYINNSLTTGSKPYSSYFGRAKTGDNYIDIKTTEGSDYIVIVKRHSDDRYINHVYIRGGEKARMYVPNGTFDIYFYSGKGWNPEKMVGNLTGGFVAGESMQKDDPQKIVSAYLEYTLYPVANGNLRLNEADVNDVMK